MKATIVYGLLFFLISQESDFVFDKEYKLLPLNELEKFIVEHKHLPNIPSEKEVQGNNGIELGDMNVKLLAKIEELTLYVIELKKENEKIREELKKLSEKK